MGCSNNQLTSLNVRGLTALTTLNCSINQLMSLNVSGLTALTSLNCLVNPLLSCIQVDNTDVATANSNYSKDATASYSLNCVSLYTTIPDANFESALIYLGYDSYPGDHKVLTANINTITSLEVDGWNISNLTGIQDFIALETLYCGNKQLMSLNVSGLTALKYLNCSGDLQLNNFSNNLTSLKVSGCTALTTLYCDSNQLTSLNVSGLTALINLSCFYNRLTSLDVSGCTALTDLGCYNNYLKSLDVSGCTALTGLSCSSNQLTNLDMSGCKALALLSCENNQLESLNLSGLTALLWLQCYANPLLACIQVDDTVAATANSNWHKDATANYSLNCNLAANSYEFNKDVVVFPNPTQAILNLSVATSIDKISITDLTGKTVLQQTLPSNQVNVQNLAKGMYILQAFSGKEKYTTKFVKE